MEGINLFIMVSKTTNPQSASASVQSAPPLFHLRRIGWKLVGRNIVIVKNSFILDQKTRVNQDHEIIQVENVQGHTQDASRRDDPP